MNAVVCTYKCGRPHLLKCPVCGAIFNGSEVTGSCPSCNCSLGVESDMKSAPRVFVDLHGVALDMCGALKGYFKDRGKSFYPEKLTDYDFNCDSGVDKSEAYAAFSDIALYDYMKPYVDAEKAIALLRTRCVPNVYSTSVDDSSIISSTDAFVQRFGLNGMLMVGRKPFISDADVLFDDCAAVHRQWASAGFSGLQYIIDRPYNKPKMSDDLLSRTIRVPSLYAGVVDMFNRFGWELPTGGVNPC